jgi:hypothetical protein
VAGDQESSADIRRQQVQFSSPTGSVNNMYQKSFVSPPDILELVLMKELKYAPGSIPSSIYLYRCISIYPVCIPCPMTTGARRRRRHLAAESTAPSLGRCGYFVFYVSVSVRPKVTVASSRRRSKFDCGPSVDQLPTIADPVKNLWHFYSYLINRSSSDILNYVTICGRCFSFPCIRWLVASSSWWSCACEEQARLG